MPSVGPSVVVGQLGGGLVLGEPALAHEPREPQFLQHGGLRWRQWDEAAVAAEEAQRARGDRAEGSWPDD